MPTGADGSPPARSAADRCPCPNAGECSQASKEAWSRHRVTTSQVVRSSVGLRNSKPSKPSWQNGKLPLDVSITEAVRIVRRLMLHQLAVLAPLADHVLVPVLAGNHDETRRDRSQAMNDSWAVDAASAVADALEMSGKYDDVQFRFPEPEELTITVDVGSQQHPLVLAFTHGHIVSSPDRMLDRWEAQSFGRQKPGEADILVSAHFHHHRLGSAGRRRTWMQIPALDGGSPWYRVRKGDDQSAGMISVWLTPGTETGWEGLTVHS
jgi:hypothetical protein